MSIDWMWCYENPEQAAAQIELLRATLDADRDGTKKLAAERDKLFDKTQSDAKVIADLRAAFLVVLKAENKCWSFENGKPCDTAHCGCLLEMQCYIDDAAFKRRVDEQELRK